MRTGYLAPEGLEQVLLRELEGVEYQLGRLIIAQGEEQEIVWAQNVWRGVEFVPFDSIGYAAKQLRARGGLWAYFPCSNQGRARLIQEKLPYFSSKKLTFPAVLPKGPLGSWTLLDEQTLVIASECSSVLPHGEYRFVESAEPPSRAYLKLWEAFTRLGCMPKKGDVCLDLGASPGSWAWVLSQLGVRGFAVDRAPLKGEFPGIEFVKGDAFQLAPEDFKEVDWVFSDVICYPEKLLGWIQKWLDAGSQANFLCTLKFQGDEGYHVVDEFKKIAGGQIIHLSHNKHELTFALLRK